MRTRIPLLIVLNVLIFVGIVFLYSPRLPIKDDVIISCSITTERELHSNSSIKYISGYIKNFSNKTLYDVSVHIESNAGGEVSVLSEEVGALIPGEVKTYLIALEEYTDNFKVLKKWATYSYG